MDANGSFEMIDFDDWTGVCIEQYTETETWTLNGNQLFKTSDGEIDEMVVFELSSHTLRIGWYVD